MAGTRIGTAWNTVSGNNVLFDGHKKPFTLLTGRWDMDRFHHSTMAHFRRSMLMEEGTFETPPVLNFSFFAQEDSNVQSGIAEMSNSASQGADLAVGRNTSVTRNLSSIEKIAENLKSVGSVQTSPILC